MMFYINAPLSPYATETERRLYEAELERQIKEINHLAYASFGVLCWLGLFLVSAALWAAVNY